MDELEVRAELKRKFNIIRERKPELTFDVDIDTDPIDDLQVAYRSLIDQINAEAIYNQRKAILVTFCH